MFRFRNPFSGYDADAGLLSSKLYDQDNFYNQFIRDMRHCRNEVIIESPFITARRMSALLPIMQQLRKRDVKVVINTRHPQEHDEPYDLQAQEAINSLIDIGVRVLYTGNHHRKIVVIDRQTLWEGSMNVLSQNDSCEIMRRIVSDTLAQQMINFLRIERFLVQ